MTLNEFKAWLDGFSAAIGDAPTPEQWATIRAKLDGVVPLRFDAPDPYRYPGTFYDPPRYDLTPMSPLYPIVNCGGRTATKN